MVARGVNPSMNACTLERRASFIVKAKLTLEACVQVRLQNEPESMGISLSRGIRTPKVAVCTCLDPAIEVRFCSSTISIAIVHDSHFISNTDDCNDEGFHSLLLDGGIFEVHSGGPVSISAADTSINNIQAPGLILSAGDGTSNTGGQGGDITITAGDGSGGETIVRPPRLHSQLVC